MGRVLLGKERYDFDAEDEIVRTDV
jgi:hypothetical protein